MLVAVDDACEVFYRARKVEADDDTITIQYMDLATVSGRAPTNPAWCQLVD
jgi:hypothetical protein